jgi:hypothetical protein
MDTKKNIWIIGENLNSGQIAAVSLLELKNYIVISGKTILNPSYRGIKLSSALSYNSLTKIVELGLLDNFIKVDSSVRCTQIGAQKLSESANGIAYGFIPSHNLFGDKRYYIQDIYNPFQNGYSESAFLYFAILPHLFKVRNQKVFLYDNEILHFLYKYLKNFRRSMKIVMKNDELVILTKNERIPHQRSKITLKLDTLNSVVYISGVASINDMKKILSQFKKYRLIIWKIPTTFQGVNSMRNAFEMNFKVVGYDMASLDINKNSNFHDSIMFAYYNEEIVNLNTVQTTSKNARLFDLITSQFK